jgi:hypothetical protein
MRLDLNTAYFKTKIMKPLQAGLAGNDVFKEYTLEDCTKVEKSGSSPSMAMLDFKRVKI